MRTSTVLAGAAITAVLSFSSAGVAMAATTSPAVVTVGSTSAAPGSTIQVSGTCAMPTTGTTFPTVISVTSPAFTGPATFINPAPDSFAATAHIATTATAGPKTVTLTCSNSAATTSVDITAVAPKPGPTPVPAPHPQPVVPAGGESRHTDRDPAFSSTTTVTAQPAEQDSGSSIWPYVGMAAIGVAAAGGGYAAAARRRSRTTV